MRIRLHKLPVLTSAPGRPAPRRAGRPGGDDLYRHLGLALVRAAAHPGQAGLPEWPASALSDAGWYEWLKSAWARAWLADAIEVASPALAGQITRLTAEPGGDPRELRRAALAVARYALRMTGRATPFGLFAGVAPARIGAELKVRWDEDHHPVLRPGSGWLADAVTGLEACPELLARLSVVASNLAFVQDGRLVAPDQQHVGSWDERRGMAVPVEVSVRATEPVEATMRYARSPVKAGDLMARLTARFPNALPQVIETMIAELVRLRLLLTSLRPPMTAPDALDHITAELDAVDADSIPRIAPLAAQLHTIRDGIARHNVARSANERRAQRARLATQPVPARVPAGQRFTVDLRLDADFTIPAAVADEAARAAAALTRLTPYPRGLPAWADYHAAFLERYGPGAVVAVLDVINTGTGLGFPATYQGSARVLPQEPLSDRDERLLALAQKTIIRGGDEIGLDDPLIAALAGAPSTGQIPPHAEIMVQLRATTAASAQRGDFDLLITGASRAFGTTTGRFLDLLGPEGRDCARLAGAALPALRPHAIVAQISCPPAHAQSESVARAPATLPHVMSMGEYPAGSSVLSLADLAVTGDPDGLMLISLSRQRPVELTVLNAVAFRRFSHPLAQFLIEVSRSRAPVYMPFSWGAAECLPYLPRIRYGRSILAPARWNLTAADLPRPDASEKFWTQAAREWQRQFRVPDRVYLGEADHRLLLDLSQDMQLALLRSQLDRRGNAELREAPGPDDCGWLDGRAHEVVIPVAARAESSAPVQPVASAALSEGHGNLPGASPWLYIKIYSHPRRQDELLAHLPDLIAAWKSPPQWWYVRYCDPEPHLRIRIWLADADAYGLAARRVGEWAAGLRASGLLSRVQFDTYFPETGRYGSAPAMAAAEEVFAADSAAALAQHRMAARSGMPSDAITAASLVDLAIALAGTVESGMRWLAGQPREVVRVERPTRDAAMRLGDPRSLRAALSAIPGGQCVLCSWETRRAVARRYRERVSIERDPLLVLPSLLHMHHIRVAGPDLARERVSLALARAAAVRWNATNDR